MYLLTMEYFPPYIAYWYPKELILGTANIHREFIKNSQTPVKTHRKNYMDIPQELVTKTIPKRKKCKKAKWLSEEDLQIAEKRSESKGERERYAHLKAEFQRTARRDKKACLSERCKDIEENNRMGKTRDLFKKTGDTKGTFHVKMGSVKDKNSRSGGG